MLRPQNLFLLVDWSRNLVTTAYDLDVLSQLGIYYGVEFESVAYYVADSTHPDAPVFDVGSGRPIWSIPEVIAVRDQRIAATVLVIDYGDGMFTDMIACVRFDPQLRRLQRRVLFDLDDRDAAIAELDRMHAEIAAESDTAS